MKRRVLISGGTGYLGRALTGRLLEQDRTPVLLTRHPVSPEQPGVEYVDLDHPSEALGAGPFEAAFHLAAADFRASLGAQLAAVLMVGNVAQQIIADQDETANLVYTGTYWQGAVGTQGCGPLNEYAAAKDAFASLARSRAAHDGVPHVLLRLGDVFGPDDDRPKFIPAVVDSVRSRTRLPATTGEQLVSYVHRDDVVDALLIAADLVVSELPPVVEYTVAGDRFEPLRSVMEGVRASSGVELPIDWGARAARARRIVAISGPPDLPGWSRRRSLADFIRSEVVA